MKNDIFDNNNNPFTVPDGYFDTLQERIMSRIQAEDNMMKAGGGRIIRMTPWRTLVAAAACILLIFSVSTLYLTHSNKQQLVAEMVIDEDFYQWLYASEEATWLAESLDFDMPENFEFDYSEENEAIISFLERDNISVAAILYSFNVP